MDAFRRRSTPFLHSSLVIEILELPRSFHGGIVDESSVPNLYRGNRSNSFFTKYGIQRKGKEKFSSIFFSWKIPFLPPSLPRKEKHTEQLSLPLAIILSRKFHRLKHAPWSSSSLVISSSLSSFPFISFRKKKRKKEGKEKEASAMVGEIWSSLRTARTREGVETRASEPSRLLVSRGAITR